MCAEVVPAPQTRVDTRTSNRCVTFIIEMLALVIGRPRSADLRHHPTRLREVTLGVDLGRVGTCVAENDLCRLEPEPRPYLRRGSVPELKRSLAVSVPPCR